MENLRAPGDAARYPGCMIEAMRKGQFATAAGVSNSAITLALKGDLADALTPDRKRIYPDHPAAVAYLEGSQLGRKRREKPPRARSTPRNGGKPAMLPGEDVFTFAQRMANLQAPAEIAPSPEPEAPAARPDIVLPGSPVYREPPLADDDEPPVWLGTKPGSLAAWSRQYIFDVERGIAGQFPDDVTDLGAMTLREMVDRFGSIELLSGLVKLLKNYADMQHKEAAAAERRGALIPRTVISSVIMPLQDLAFTRLVTEAPGAVAEQIIARVLSAASQTGEGKTGDLRLDVEALIRRENSTILQSCVERTAKIVEEL